MRFLLDLQVLQSESRNRGIGRYSRGLAQGLLCGPNGAGASALLNLAVTQSLAERAKASQPTADSDYWNEFDEIKQWIANCNAGTHVSVFRGLSGIAGMLSADWARVRACETLYDGYLDSLGIDLVHIPSPFDGFGDDTVVGWTDLCRSGPVRVATVYDLVAFEQPELYLADPVRDRWYRHRLAGLLKADLLVTISEHTRRVALAILNLAPERVISIGADTDPIFRRQERSPQEKASLLQKYGISKPFVMHVGILEGRKNVETLVRAFAQLPSEIRAAHQLVLVADATPQQISDLRKTARQSGLDFETVVFPGFVPDYDLAGLYSASRVVVMPSLAEGFGLPVLEAMRCGAPVLASDATSLPEVVGNQQLLFDPTQPIALAEKLKCLLADDGFRQFALDHCALQEKQFSWTRTAARAHEAFAEAVARRQAEGPNSKERIQYILVPALALAKSDVARVENIAATLGNTGDILLTAPHAQKLTQLSGKHYPGIEPDRLSLAPHQRTLILPQSEGLDLYQQAILSQIPSLVLLPKASENHMPAEWLYQSEGYSGLLAATSETSEIAFNALPDAYHQIIGVLADQGDTELAAKIETLYESHPASVIVKILSQLEPDNPLLCAEIASAIAENHTADPARSRLLVDISELVHRDARSGIQRVVRNILKQLLTGHFQLRVEPIYRDADVYRYARRFTCAFLNLEPLNLRDAIVDFYPSDTFLGLDLDISLSERAVSSLRELRCRGGSVNFVIYDLLPVTRPELFPSELVAAFENWFDRIKNVASRLIAISQSVADEVFAGLLRKSTQRAEKLELSWYHIGSGFNGFHRDAFLQDVTSDWADALFRLAGRTVFLTVGTIEPRKGISQLLDAAEEIWRDHDATFVLVGKEGWLVTELVCRIKQHPELNKRLFWFGQVTDELLSGLYRMATAVILPSEAEGFGLPLIEAACLNTPIIARDIPVFREIGGEGAFYFRSENGKQLAAALRDWLRKNATHDIPDPTTIKVLNWQQATEQLVTAVQGRKPYRSWGRRENNLDGSKNLL
jgi:glycosyltransferase involved in cell wall biosynthesis